MKFNPDKIQTQAQLDAALTAKAPRIYIVGGTISDPLILRATGSSHVEAWGSSHVVAWERSHVVAGQFVSVQKMLGHLGSIRGGFVIAGELGAK